MTRDDLARLRYLVWKKRRSGATGEIDEQIRPLRDEFTVAAAVIHDPVMKTALLYYYAGIRPKEMDLRYSDRHIYRLVKKAEEIITREQ